MKPAKKILAFCLFFVFFLAFFLLRPIPVRAEESVTWNNVQDIAVGQTLSFDVLVQWTIPASYCLTYSTPTGGTGVLDTKSGEEGNLWLYGTYGPPPTNGTGIHTFYVRRNTYEDCTVNSAIIDSTTINVYAAPSPTSTPTPTTPPTPTPTISTVCEKQPEIGIVSGAWDAYGFGVTTNTTTQFKVIDPTPVTGATYWWKFGNTAWLKSNVEINNVTKNYSFSAPGDYTLSVGYNYDTEGNPNSGGIIRVCGPYNALGDKPPVARVYNNCGDATFDNGKNLSVSSGESTSTCGTPAAGGCVGGAVYSIAYGGSGPPGLYGRWGYFGASTTRIGSTSWKEITVTSGGGLAGPDFAAYPPVFGFKGSTDGFGSTCFRLESTANTSAFLNLGSGTIYCRSGSCVSAPTGEHDSHIVSLEVVSGSCKIYSEYNNEYRCQLKATADMSKPATYRLGAITGGSVVKVAEDTYAEQGSAEFEWEDINNSFSNPRSISFVPSESGALEKISLKLRRLGAGTTWVNMKVALENDCWSDACDIPPAITGVGGERAEAGAKIYYAQSYQSPSSGDWFVFYFTGSRPTVTANTWYRIYVETSSGQNSTTTPPQWHKRVISSGQAQGTHRTYEVYIRENGQSGGTMIENPSGNPLSGICDTITPCYVWWRPAYSGSHLLAVDLLNTNPSRVYSPDSVGKRTTTAFTTYNVTVPSPTPTPTSGPWFQTRGGDVHSSGDISSPIPSPAPNRNFSRDLAGYPGVVSYGGMNASFLPAGSVSTRGWLANDIFTSTFSYSYFSQKLSGLSSNPLSCSESGCTVPTNSGLYTSTGPVNINTSWTVLTNTKLILLINGDLNIGPSVTINVPYGSFLAFIVNGNINISGGVGDKTTGTFTAINAHLQGIYLAEGVIDTYEPQPVGVGSGFRLVAAGSFFARQGFRLERDLKNDIPPAINNASYPAELFIFRPDLIINAPSTLFSSSFSWREVAP